ncbi:MAG: FecR domain-containing protein [Odoribacter sp.]
MDKMMTYQFVANLIVKEQLGTIEEAEAKELAMWLAESVHNQWLYEKLKQKDFTEEIKKYRRIDIEKGLKKYHKLQQQRKRRRMYRWASVAAAVVILFSIGVNVFYHFEDTTLKIATIQPGASKATLVLSDGSVRYLDQTNQEEVIKLAGVTVANNGVQLQYTLAAMDTLRNELNLSTDYNELCVPTGGEFQLVLEDGTKVWLNSQTKIRYPVFFSKREREIYLEGEAYFEVAHDANRPFYVRTKEEVKVQVLGTSFNVRAYGDEDCVETVLEKGSVRMWRGSENMILKPGFRAIYDRKIGQMSAASVDTELYTAWREGHFIFYKESIEQILLKLSRWYGMEVFFSSEEAKKIIFTGDVRKYDTIKNLLEAMEISGGVHFDINGNTIQVTCRN